VREEYEPRLRRMKTEAQTGGWLTPSAPSTATSRSRRTATRSSSTTRRPATEIERFATFPRRPTATHSACRLLRARRRRRRDVAALQVVTVGDALLERSERMMREGDYTEGYYLHGFGVRLAEAGAEYVNRHIVARARPRGQGAALLVGLPRVPRPHAAPRACSGCCRRELDPELTGDVTDQRGWQLDPERSPPPRSWCTTRRRRRFGTSPVLVVRPFSVSPAQAVPPGICRSATSSPTTARTSSTARWAPCSTARASSSTAATTS
jgi:hypothetical protein